MGDYSSSNTIRDDSAELLRANNQGNPSMRQKAGINQKQRDQKKSMRRSSMSQAIPPVSASGIGDSSYSPPFLEQFNIRRIDVNQSVANTNNIKTERFGLSAPSLRSKASGFLLGVIRKKLDDKQELNEPYKAMFEKTRTNAPCNHLSAGRKSVEHQSALTSAMPSFDRIQTSSSLLSLDHSQQIGVRQQTLKNDCGANIDPLIPNEIESQVYLTEILNAIKTSKKDLQKQVDFLCELLLRLQAINAGSRQSILEDLVSQGIINEIVTSMREFRFHLGLQTLCIDILTMISQASELYAYAMSDVDIDTIVEKAIFIHIGQERLVALGSTLIRTIRKSRHSDNVKKHLDEESKNEKQKMASNTEQIVPSSQSKTFKKQQNPDNHESYALSKMKTPLIDHASRGRFPSQSASGFRRALAGDTSPPILSSSYSLAFARRLNISSNIDINEGNISQCSSSNLCGDATKREIKSAPITSSASSLSSSSSSKTIVCEQKDKLRPSSTPSPVRNASNHLETMASIYNGVPVFVEALPISVRISEVAQGNGSPYYKRNRLEMKSAGYIRHSPLKEQSHLRGNTVNTSNITQDSTGDSELLDILQGMDVGAEKMSPHNNQKKTVDLSLKRPTTCGASRPNDDENGLHQKYNARSQCEHQRPATASCSLLHSKGSVVKNVSGTFQGSAKVPSKDRGEDLDGDDDPKILQQAQEEYTRGLQHQKDGNLAKAIECYEKALCMKGTHQFSALYINLGSVYMCQREYEQALWSFERAEEIQPGNVKAIYNMALALSRLGKPVEAQEKFTRVLKLDPMHENAMRALNLANEDVV